MSSRDKWSKFVKDCKDFKDKAVKWCKDTINKIYSALLWAEIKLVSMKNWVIRVFDNAIMWVKKTRIAIGKFIEDYRINKVAKLEEKTNKIKKKIAYL